MLPKLDDEDVRALLRELRRREGWTRVPDLATALGWRRLSHRVGRMRARAAARALDAAGVATMRRVGRGHYEIRLLLMAVAAVLLLDGCRTTGTERVDYFEEIMESVVRPCNQHAADTGKVTREMAPQAAYDLALVLNKHLYRRVMEDMGTLAPGLPPRDRQRLYAAERERCYTRVRTR